MQKSLVLVVEDEPAQNELISYNLKSEGFDIITAESGDDALLLVSEEQLAIGGAEAGGGDGTC